MEARRDRGPLAGLRPDIGTMTERGWAIPLLHPVPPARVLRVVAEAFGTTVETLRARDKTDEWVNVARAVAAHLLVELCEISSRRAGVELARDGSCVRSNGRRLAGYRAKFPRLDEVIARARHEALQSGP